MAMASTRGRATRSEGCSSGSEFGKEGVAAAVVEEEMDGGALGASECESSALDLRS